MKRTLLVLVLITLTSACGQSTPTLSATPNPTSTSTIIVTQTPSQTPIPPSTSTPTQWIRTYPTKQALVIYGVGSRNQFTQLFIDRGDFYFNPFLTLYADGQLIFGPGVYEKHLSEKEVDAILMKLKQLGFFALQDAYATNAQSLFYTDSTEPFKAETGSVEITVNNGQESKSIGFAVNNEEYLIQPIKDILTYLKSFSTNGATLYEPDRLLVGIETEKEIPSLHDAVAIPWPNDITPPSRMSYDGVLYLEGTEALELYTIVKESKNNIFIFEGIKFVANLRPVLPNECHIYHYSVLKIDTKNSQPYFSCDGW